jgi:hypothetical protein
MSILSTNKLRRLPLGFSTLDPIFQGLSLQQRRLARKHGFLHSLYPKVRAQFQTEQDGLGSSTTFINNDNRFDPTFL